MIDAFFPILILVLSLFLVAFPVVALTSPAMIPLTLIGLAIGFAVSIIICAIISKRN